MEDLCGDRYLLSYKIFIKMEEMSQSLPIERGFVKALRQEILGEFKE